MRFLRFAYIRRFVPLFDNSGAVRIFNTNEVLNLRLAVFDILLWRYKYVNQNG